MKKDGSVLIEVIASVCIITIVITAFMQAYVSSINNLKSRMLEEELNMCIYNLSNEIKIVMRNCSNDKAEFQIEACISADEHKIEKKYAFNKSWWMNEI